MPLTNVLVPITFFLVLGFVMYLFFKTRHSERIAMIEKGINPINSKENLRRFSSLKNGILAISLGIGFLIGHVIDSIVRPDKDPLYIFACLLIFGGMGLLFYYNKVKEEGLFKYEDKETVLFDGEE